VVGRSSDGPSVIMSEAAPADIPRQTLSDRLAKHHRADLNGSSVHRGGARTRRRGWQPSCRSARTRATLAAVTPDPTARALRAVHVLAADLAAERRETAVLRRRVADLEAEIERLQRGLGPPRSPETHRSPGSCATVRVAEPA
jgi:hypothetical protein